MLTFFVNLFVFTYWNILSTTIVVLLWWSFWDTLRKLSIGTYLEYCLPS